MSYFIEAASQIIDEEGIEDVTTRKVAEIAGYNIATMYNYFENLDHLIFFALLKYLKVYLFQLRDYTKDAEDSLERYYLIWEIFCLNSFQNPLIYDNLFFKQFTNPPDQIMQKYYEIFPEELEDIDEELNPMLLNPNLNQRNLALLKNCVNDGFIREEVLDELNEMTLLIYQSMLQRVISKQVEYTPEEATSRTLKYLKYCIKVHRDCL